MQRPIGTGSGRNGSTDAGRVLRGFAAGLVLATMPLLAVNADAAGRSFRGIDHGGVVYVMTNDSEGNEILVYFRDRRGRLHAAPRATASTGGLGGSVPTAPVDPLGSQGALVYDPDSNALFAVNAGDDTVSVFDTGLFGAPLSLRAVVPSGGNIPVSVAVSEGLLYVLNAGGTASVATFRIGHGGHLTQIGSLGLGVGPTATTPPFDEVPSPGQVGVDTLSRHLIVTHAGGQELLTSALDDDGIPVGPLVSTMTPGEGTFAFGVTRFGSTLVAEAATGSVSAFDPPVGNMPLVATASAVPTGGGATCWIVVQDDGFAYVSNTASDTLSLYGYTRTGGLDLLEPIAATTGDAPIDMTLANGGGYLYSLDAASGQISGFSINRKTGALRRVETETGLPAAAGIQGIASRDF